MRKVLKHTQEAQEGTSPFELEMKIEAEPTAQPAESQPPTDAMSEKVDVAKTLFHNGNIQECANACEVILQESPNHAETINLLGIVSHQLGKHQAALNLLKQAHDLDPDNPIIHYNRALILRSQGHLKDALGAFQQTIKYAPKFAAAYLQTGSLLREMHRPHDAVTFLKLALILQPSNEQTIYSLGNTYNILAQYDEAIICFQTLIKKHPKNTHLYINLGVAYQRQNEIEKAVQCYQAAISLDPSMAEAYSNLGVAYRHIGKYEDAISCYQRAIDLGIEVPSVFCNYGHALQELLRYDEAMAYFEKALALDKNFAETYESIALNHQARNNLKKTKEFFTQALKLHPEAHTIRYNYAKALLLDSDYINGFKQFEARWQKPKYQALQPKVERWSGDNLKGKTLLIHTEKHTEDTIQFLRYIPLIEKGNGKIILQCHDAVIPLCQQFTGIDQVIADIQTVTDIDYFTGIASLPYLFKTTIDSVPHKMPYIHNSETHQKAWAKHIRNSKVNTRIGIVWNANAPPGKDRGCSCELNHFLELSKIKKTKFYSLQIGRATEDLANNKKIKDLNEHITDLTHLASAIERLDLIITVDCATAHLAGALNKPTWVLLPFSCTWPWGLKSDKTPWYPSLRLYRQQEPGNWEDVFVQVTESLNKLTDK